MSKVNSKKDHSGDLIDSLEELGGYICPLSINYHELKAIIGNLSIEDYIGENLPKDEVKRIKNDYEIYLKNK